METSWVYRQRVRRFLCLHDVHDLRVENTRMDESRECGKVRNFADTLDKEIEFKKISVPSFSTATAE